MSTLTFRSLLVGIPLVAVFLLALFFRSLFLHTEETATQSLREVAADAAHVRISQLLQEPRIRLTENELTYFRLRREVFGDHPSCLSEVELLSAEGERFRKDLESYFLEEIEKRKDAPPP